MVAQERKPSRWVGNVYLDEELSKLSMEEDLSPAGSHGRAEQVTLGWDLLSL